jgi:hypothetical protein
METQHAEGVKIKLETFFWLWQQMEMNGQLYLPPHFRHSDGNDEDMRIKLRVAVHRGYTPLRLCTMTVFPSLMWSWKPLALVNLFLRYAYQ